jgi:hypothetical protein
MDEAGAGPLTGFFLWLRWLQQLRVALRGRFHSDLDAEEPVFDIAEAEARRWDSRSSLPERRGWLVFSRVVSFAPLLDQAPTLDDISYMYKPDAVVSLPSSSSTPL